MRANATVPTSERNGAIRTSGPMNGPPAVTCVLIGNRDLRVVALADVTPAAAGASADPDLAQLADILERAAIALRSDAPAVLTARETPAPGHRRPSPLDPIRLGQLEVHADTRLVLRAGEPVPLSRIEFDLFLALVRRGGAPASRLELVREVWGFGAAVTSRSVDTQIYNLRHKLEENPATPRHLLTVSGVGYRVAP